jgi:hypothetical protein
MNLQFLGFLFYMFHGLLAFTASSLGIYYLLNWLFKKETFPTAILVLTVLFYLLSTLSQTGTYVGIAFGLCAWFYPLYRSSKLERFIAWIQIPSGGFVAVWAVSLFYDKPAELVSLLFVAATCSASGALVLRNASITTLINSYTNASKQPDLTLTHEK